MPAIDFTVDNAKPIGPGPGGFITDQYSQGPLVIQCVVTGTVDYTIEVTNSDPFGSNVYWFNHTEPATVNATASLQTSLYSIPRSIRVVRNSGSGSIDCSISQISKQA